MKVRTRKLAVFVTCLGLAAAFPILSSADQGGVPHSKKECKLKKKAKKHPRPNLKGKKCGFNNPGTPTGTGVTTALAPTGSTTSTTQSTPSTTSTTVSTTSGM